MTRTFLSTWMLLPAALALPSAHAVTTSGVPAALSAITLDAGNGVTSPVQVNSNNFGTHQAAMGSAQVQASVGSDAQAVPFMSFSGSASGISWFNVAGTLEYYWMLQGAPSSSPVPVTISTLGHLQGSVTAQSLLADRRVGTSANWLGMSISTSLGTYVGASGALTELTAGLTTGNRFNPAWTKIHNFGTDAVSDPGGQATSSGSGSFSQSFELMVMPNAVNRIVMQIGAGAATGFMNDRNVAYNWSMSGYVDPVITVGAAFANDYSVLQSAIPMAPVPEVPALAMLLSGLALMAGVARKTK
jgi:hypothetical protein